MNNFLKKKGAWRKVTSRCPCPNKKFLIEKLYVIVLYRSHILGRKLLYRELNLSLAYKTLRRHMIILRHISPSIQGSI